jgi:ribulose-phosphate 3-epimerase
VTEHQTVRASISVVRYKLAPSILGADFARLGEQIQAVDPYADLFHVDAMDGHFVPPITIGPVVVKAIRKITTKPLECHLMVTDPVGQAEQFAQAGGDAVVFHLEATNDPAFVIKRLRELGLGVALSINPPTPLDEALPYFEEIDAFNVMTVNPGWAGQAFIEEMLPKIDRARAEVERRELHADIAVDGGVTAENARRCLDAGANVLGAATAIFGHANPAAAASELKELLREREKHAVR